MSSPSQAQPRAIPQQIVIDYNANPPGQVGIRPQRVSRNNTFVFTQKDPGTLTIEFLGKSPLADGARVVSPGRIFTAVEQGRFPFKCTLVRPNGQTVVLDPTVEGSLPGGELEVPPED